MNKKKRIFIIISFIFCVISLLALQKNTVLQSSDSRWSIKDIKHPIIPYYNNDLKNTKTGKKYQKKISIGIIDGRIDTSNIHYKNLDIQTKSFIPENKITQIDVEHGTSNLGIITSNYAINELYSMIDSKYVNIYSAEVLNNGFSKQKDVVESIRWLIENEVDVINISLDFNIIQKDLLDALNITNSSKIPVLISYGNGNYSTNKKEKINEYTWYIKSSETKDVNKNYISLPGTNMLSISSKNSYDSYSGSSYSTALATGIIAKNILENRLNTHESKEIEKVLNNYMEEIL